MTIRKIAVGLAFVLVSSFSFAQQEEAAVNPNSLLRIPKYEQLYKMKVWRIIDLHERQNKGYFATGNEITRLILKAINSGELAVIYNTDSLDEAVFEPIKTKDKFYEGMVSQPGQTFPDWAPATNFFATDPVTFNGKNYEAIVNSTGKNPATSPNEWQATSAGKAVLYGPQEIYKLTIVEDVIFDKRRSRLYYDMLAIGLEAFNQDKGFFEKLGWFKYKDLEVLFRNHVKDAVWFNRYNSAENRNYADAFLLRLFRGTIFKVENPNNESILDIYLDRPYSEGVWAMEWEEMKMMEKEHNLWEY